MKCYYLQCIYNITNKQTNNQSLKMLKQLAHNHLVTKY